MSLPHSHRGSNGLHRTTYLKGLRVVSERKDLAERFLTVYILAAAILAKP